MAKRVYVFADRRQAVPKVGEHVIDWCVANKGHGLGGATGRSPVDVWKWIWDALDGKRSKARKAVTGQPILFLDEYFGAFPSYYHWAWRNLRVGVGGFPRENVFVPRGCFFESNRLVTGDRLEEILEDWEEDWQALTEPGEDGVAPEIRIQAKAEHPVLADIRAALEDYDALARDHSRRLQLLGIGVCGHIGFVESGAAARPTTTMLVRLAPSTLRANEADFALRSNDGDAALEPARFAVTQGISTILSAGELLLLAWGESKRAALERMFLGTPGPKNPAAWLQSHDNVTVFLDRAAFGNLKRKDLEGRGWAVEVDRAVPAVV